MMTWLLQSLQPSQHEKNYTENIAYYLEYPNAFLIPSFAAAP